MHLPPTAQRVSGHLQHPVHPAQVVWWTRFQETFGGELDAQQDVFGGDKGPSARKALRTRVTEHNILVIAGYYRRLRMARLAQLLDLSQEEVCPAWRMCSVCWI